MVWLLGIAAVYAAYTVAQWSYGYIDFGDGNYLYIGWRIAQGDIVYRDILAPQPPLHLYAGALVWKISQWIQLAEPLYAFRAASLLLRLVAFGLVVALARRAWGRPAVAVLAGAIFLWLPIGHRWAIGWQSEPLEIVWLLGMALAALRGTRAADLLAGVLATLAAMTNLTAAPFLLVLILYMAVREPRRVLWMGFPSVALAAAITLAMELKSGGMFLDNAVFNQVGTYPQSGLLQYALFDKLIPQSISVLTVQGFFVFAGLIGLARFLRETPLPPAARGGLAWFFTVTLGSILYVTKGGTMDYIFSLAEPAVAVLAAGEVGAWLARWWPARLEAPPGALPASPGLRRATNGLAALAIAFFALAPGAIIHHRLWTQDLYEFNERGTLEVRQILADRAHPHEPVLAPPFYAFLAQRPLWGHYSEIFIWTVKWRNDLQAGDPTGEGLRKVRMMAAALREQRLPVVILEMDQTGIIPEVMGTLVDDYMPLRTELIQTRNTRLGVFVPVPPGREALQLARWQAFANQLRDAYGREGVRIFEHWFRAIPTTADSAQGLRP